MDSILYMRGPAFLAFYFGLGITVNLMLRFFISWREKKSTHIQQSPVDPYKIACLRVSHLETMRIVLFSLIDRGLLKASGDRVAAETTAQEMVRRPLEKTVAAFFGHPRPVKEMFKDSGAVNVAKDYRQALVDEGLLAGLKVYLTRMPLVLAALVLLLWISIAKIISAVSRGHYNVMFLIVLTLVFAFWTVAIWKKNRPGAGDHVLREAQRKFQTLKRRAKSVRPGGTTTDASFLAAVYGLSVLPTAYFPYITTVFPRAESSSGADSGGCGGGGCGSSGCGGGGCGGGCGGCGS